MRLWYISQNEVFGYNTYSDAVVAAETEQEARLIHPANYEVPWDGIAAHAKYAGDAWSDAAYVKVGLLGDAVAGVEAGVICASFHAG